MENICTVSTNEVSFDANGELINIKIDDIISVKPASLNKVNPFTGDVLFRNFPRISVITKSNRFEIPYPSFHTRDEDYEMLINAVKSYNSPMLNESNKLGSANNRIAETKRLIYHIKKEILKVKSINPAIKHDIIECVEDIREKTFEGEKIPGYIYNCLSRMAAEVPPIVDYVYQLRQL